MLTKCVLVFFIVGFYKTGLAIPESYWQGNWFPVDPGSTDTNDRTIFYSEQVTKPDLRDEKHGIKMGISDPDCDDAETKLNVDWNGSRSDYTCYEGSFKPNYNISPVEKCDNIPAKYNAYHLCMNVSIHYRDAIPTFGNHRPLWARYGEFRYVPKQRWLHNLEHGGIVMLYHPCADHKEVFKLKKILRNCMWKHIISASKDLTEERPIALLSWGCRFYMNVVDKKLALNFIKTHAMNGPEEMYGQGWYKKGLIKDAKLISDKNDTVICPNSYF